MFRFVVTYRRCVLTAAVLLPLAAVVAADPTWAEAAGMDVWNYGELASQLEQSRADHDRLLAEDAEIQERMAMKEQLVTELINGHATLSEVTSQFAAINAARPEYMAVIRINYPGGSDEEKVAHNVIEYTLPRVSDDPAKRDAVLARLDREFRGMFPHAAAVVH